MPTPAVIVINHDRTLQAEMEKQFADTPYDLISHSYPEDARQMLAQEPAAAAAVVVNLPSDAPAEQEQALMAHLQNDPDAQQIPVLVCSDRPATLQSAVRSLQQRPGAVHASSADPQELVVQVHVLEVASS